MQTITPNRRTSSQSASWRRRRCAVQVAAHSPHPAQRRPHASATYRALATALTSVALAALLLVMAGSLSSAPQAQTHAVTISPAAPSVAVDLAAFADMRGQTSAALALRYQRGYSVQGSWLCYGWPSGAYHCTQHWRRSGGRYASLNPSWVPSQGSAQTSHLSSVHTVAVRNTYPFGQCTWGAQQLRLDENLSGLGNAGQWLRNAERRGLPTGYTPRVGATVVFAPGVDGASWLGHVGHVVAIGSGGRFEIEAMNDAAGWGRYAFRWVQMRAGVSFIY